VNPWFIFPRPKADAAIRLFCFHYAGGSASIFRQWPQGLPTVEVCVVQQPGRATRIGEAAAEHSGPLLETLSREIEPLLDRPFAFFGHSMGALVAFELSRAVRARTGRAPAHLFVSGRRAPHLPSRRPALAALLSAWLNHVARFVCLLVSAPGMIPWIRRPLRDLKSLVDHVSTGRGV